jgi:hypothetical protein
MSLSYYFTKRTNESIFGVSIGELSPPPSHGHSWSFLTEFPDSHSEPVTDGSSLGAISERFARFLTGAEVIQPHSRKSLRVIADERRFARYERVKNFIANSEFGRPSQNMLEALVDQNPDLLLDIITSGQLRSTMLTYAAEIAGRLEYSVKLFLILQNLLTHEENFVREGAVYGLAFHIKRQTARDLLRRHLEIEQSPGVREAIEETLEGVNDSE